MANQFFQTQYILNKVFDSENNALRIITGGGIPGSSLTGEQNISVAWLTENLDTIKSLINAPEIVLRDSIQSKDIVLNPNNPPGIIGEDGSHQDSDETGGKYFINVAGYVLNIEVFEDISFDITNRYYTNITFDAATGISQICLEKNEYDLFSSYPNGKNILRIFYLPVGA